MNYLAQLRTLKGLTHNESVIVEAIINDPQAFITIEPKVFCTQNYVSLSSLYRLVDKLGHDGIVEFKMELTHALLERNQSVSVDNIDYPFAEKEDTDTSLLKLKALYSETVHETSGSLETNQVTLAAKSCCEAKNITVFATAGNINFAKNFAFQMLEIGMHVSIPVDEYEMKLHASLLTPQDIAIIISYEGRGVGTLLASEILKEKNVPYILISSLHENPLKNDALALLHLASQEDHANKISSFGTRLSLLYVLDALYTEIFKYDYSNNLVKKREYYENLSSYNIKLSK